MADEMLQAPTAPVRPQPKHWYGYISWTAQDGNTRQTREWAAFVIGREVPGTAGDEPAKPELWPPQLSISTKSFSPLNFQELDKLVKVRRIPMWGFFPAPPTIEGVSPSNEQVYLSLFMMLLQRNVMVSVSVQFFGQQPGGGIILFPVRTTQETSAKIFGLVFMNEDMPRMNQAGISLSPSIPNTAGPVPPLHFPQQQQSPVQSQSQSQSQPLPQPLQLQLQPQPQPVFSAGQAVGFGLSGPAAQQSQQLRQIFLAQEARARQRAALLFAPQNPPAGSAGGSALFPPAPLIVNAFGFNPWPPMYNLASNPGGGDLGQLQAQIRPQQEQEEHQQQQQTYAINRPQFLNDLGMPPAQQLGTWGVHHRQPSGPMQTPAENGNAGGNGSGVPMMPTAMDILQAYLASQSTGTHGPR